MIGFLSLSFSLIFTFLLVGIRAEIIKAILVTLFRTQVNNRRFRNQPKIKRRCDKKQWKLCNNQIPFSYRTA